MHVCMYVRVYKYVSSKSMCTYRHKKQSTRHARGQRRRGGVAVRARGRALKRHVLTQIVLRMKNRALGLFWDVWFCLNSWRRRGSLE
jgi:hypothetical protein